MRTLRCLLVASLLVAAPTAAQSATPPATEEAREEARELAKRGYLQFQQGNHASAIELFERADALVAAPTHVLFIARSQVALGRLAAALASYETIVGMALKADDPEAFRRALVDADAELAALRPRVPTLAVEVDGADRGDVVLEVDGVRLGEEPLPLDPGDHEIVATVPWAEPLTRAVSLAEGQQEVVTWTIPPPPTDGVDGEHDYLVPAAITLGLGGALVIAGAATGIVSLSQVDAIKTRCIDNRCPPEDEAEADSARALGHASTALFVVGGLAAAAGTTLLVLGWPEEPATSAQLVVTPGGFRLEGRF